MQSSPAKCTPWALASAAGAAPAVLVLPERTQLLGHRAITAAAPHIHMDRATAAPTCIIQPSPQLSTAQDGPCCTVDHSCLATSPGLYWLPTIQLACCSAKSPASEHPTEHASSHVYTVMSSCCCGFLAEPRTPAGTVVCAVGCAVLATDQLSQSRSPAVPST